MPVLKIKLDTEETPFDAVAAANARLGTTGLPPDVLVHLADETALEVGGLDAGMASGKPSVMFCFPLPDGRVVIAETSLALLLTAADALKARYGDPR